MNIRYIVQCLKHGKETKDWHGKQVVVPAPKNKNERKNGGCPFCKQEAATEAVSITL